ncbi:MAG: 3-dehydroquinate dehydratase, partial [Myxococcales bacterium]
DAAMAAPPASAQPTKTLGRLPPPEAASVPKSVGRAAESAGKLARPPGGITRAEVRERIAQKLGNRLSTGALASWAREQWLNVERGAPAEAGQRELLTEALQTLALASTPAGQLSDGELVDLMTRLDR